MLGGDADGSRHIVRSVDALERARVAGATHLVVRTHDTDEAADLSVCRAVSSDQPPPATRAQLLDRARRLRAEIEQIFIDAASWNDNARPPGEAPIDPDPDGQLRRIADGLDRMLASEGRRARSSRPASPPGAGA